MLYCVIHRHEVSIVCRTKKKIKSKKKNHAACSNIPCSIDMGQSRVDSRSADEPRQHASAVAVEAGGFEDQKQTNRTMAPQA